MILLVSFIFVLIIVFVLIEIFWFNFVLGEIMVLGWIWFVVFGVKFIYCVNNV